MGPKFAKGAKVRIKPQDHLGKAFDPGLKSYERMRGEILEATDVVAFVSESAAAREHTGKRVSIYRYTVRVNEEITLYDIAEDYLEISNL